jgi:signal transduction histidine kinase/DNA-binding response OmpR family regulator
MAQEKESFNPIGIPLIKYYLPKDYSAGMQNWTILQDRRGVMYFGNGRGVLEYDGGSWRLIPVPNKGARCLAIDAEGTIFVGGLNEIGYLSPDSSGALKYISLNKSISKEQLNIGDIWSIVARDNKLYFQSFNNLYILEAKKGKEKSFAERIADHPIVTKFQSETKFNRLFLLNDRIYIQIRTTGLYEIVNDKLILKIKDDDLKQDLICMMLPHNLSHKVLLGLVREGLFLWDGNKVEKFNNEADDYLLKNRLYWDGAVLQDGSYAMGTQSGGIVILDADGKLKRIIDKNNGLNNKNIWDLFVDKRGTLWASQNQGIAKINYPSSLQIMDEKSGFEGTINDINFLERKVYLSTSAGIYCNQKSSELSQKQMFSPVKGSNEHSWQLLPVGNVLLTATINGVSEIKNNSASIINGTSKFVTCLYRSKIDSSIIYIGLSGLANGLEILKFENGQFRNIGKVTNVATGIKNIEQDGSGNLWLITSHFRKIIGLKTPKKLTDLSGYDKINIKNETILTDDIKLFRYKNSVYFYNSKTVFIFDSNEEKFIPSDLFAGIFKDPEQTLNYIYSDKHDILWCVSKKNATTELQQITIPKDQYYIKHYPFLQMINDISSSNFISLFPIITENKGLTLWAAEGNILARYDIESKNTFINTPLIHPLIRRIFLNRNNNIYYGFEKNRSSNDIKGIAIDYSNKLIGFEFALPDYLNEEDNEYQYKLEGFDKDWSSWSKGTKKEYTNLSAGEYFFKVRGRNAIGIVSDQTIAEFEILMPWYMTWWTRLAGIIIVLFIINYVMKMRVQYLKEKNILLEKMVGERTQKINEQKETLEEQADKLLELNRAKSNLFANISHEFRTPLTLIKGQLENLLEIEHDEVVKKKINIAYTNSNRLHSLINQILDLSKMESWKIKIKLVSINIVPVVLGRVASFELLAQEKGIELITICDINSLPVRIDKEKFEKVIDNLLSNAFKFTQKGGIVSVSIDRIKSELIENAQICVSDTGIGIPEDKMPFIFGRYYQVDDSKTRKYEGTGLGLAIVKELVELQNGIVSVESTLGKGSKFIVTLPVEEEGEITQVNKDNKIEFNSDDTESVKELILIVEDNADVRSYIKDNLELNYKILEAADGEEGIQKAFEYIPDLIISDLMMPKIDGFGLCTTLKNDKKTSHIPIIILTALDDEKSKIEGLKTGADDYLSKPFSSKELGVRVENLLHIREVLREKYREVSVLKAEDIKANPIEKEFIEKVFVIINNHLEDNQFDVQKLADDVGMSVSQINRKLSAIINSSAGKLIRTTRMDYAAKLLSAGAENISEIANKVGFSNIPAFSNSFKSQFGIAPSEYRKNSTKY